MSKLTEMRDRLDEMAELEDLELYKEALQYYIDLTDRLDEGIIAKALQEGRCIIYRSDDE